MTSTTLVKTPTSRVRFGHARAEITPPVGIYHRLWGAARHERATGVHRPLVGDLMVIGPIDGSAAPFVRANLDFCGLVDSQQNSIAEAIGEGAGVPRERVIVSHSHTHSGGWFVPDRFALPGGELIAPFLEEVTETLRRTASQAKVAARSATITYGNGRCDMAANRDYWDDRFGSHTCGFNPDTPADDTVVVGRVTDDAGQAIATIVNYACHPTTLAWENSLISPDFVGALRETVEIATSVPCVFAQGACGDLGPRHGFVGDVGVADRNGRQLGFAALSALTALVPPLADFGYDGQVVSGATLGVWSYRPFDSTRQLGASRFGGDAFTVDLTLKPRPDANTIRREQLEWEDAQRKADARSDVLAARDAGARAERARRWLARLADLPPGSTYPLGFTVHRLGDAVWVTCGGEPYNVAQVELRHRFPEKTVLFSPVSGNLQVAYLLPRDRYGKGLYQEEPSILAPGCLETLVDAISERIRRLE
jgi:hypothetical protein